jgi:hypothetical protein
MKAEVHQHLVKVSANQNAKARALVKGGEIGLELE